MPNHLLYRSNQQYPGNCTCRCDRSEYGEWPIKLASPIQQEPSDCRCHNPCKVANEILETSPPARGLRPRERLRDRPDIGSRSAEKNHTHYDHDYAKGWAGNGS